MLKEQEREKKIGIKRRLNEKEEQGKPQKKIRKGGKLHVKRGRETKRRVVKMTKL